MIRKYLYLIAGIMIILFGAGEVKSEASFNFNDIEQSVFREAIIFMKNQEFITGYSDGSYKPFNKVNRAELLTIVYIHNERM